MVFACTSTLWDVKLEKRCRSEASTQAVSNNLRYDWWMCRQGARLVRMESQTKSEYSSQTSYDKRLRSPHSVCVCVLLTVYDVLLQMRCHYCIGITDAKDDVHEFSQLSDKYVRRLACWGSLVVNGEGLLWILSPHTICKLGAELWYVELVSLGQPLLITSVSLELRQQLSSAVVWLVPPLVNTFQHVIIYQNSAISHDPLLQYTAPTCDCYDRSLLLVLRISEANCPSIHTRSPIVALRW